MNKYLVITIRFLADRYHGRTENGREPEWPPSPLRLYQAILAGAAPRWHDSSLRDRELPAFEWFESLGAPQICAPKAQRGRPLLKYVRENLSDVDPEKRDAKFSRPTLFCGEPKLTYSWSIDSKQDESASVIASCAQHCRALGWGIDMAVGHGAVVESEPECTIGEKWLPMPNVSDGIPLRVPRQRTSLGQSGTLHELSNRFSASLDRIADDGRNPVPPLTVFRVVGYRRTTDIPGRQFAAFKLLHPDQERLAYFSATLANCVAAMTRHTTATAAQGLSWVDSFVHGHRSSEEDTKPRFSYLPLPTIEPRGQGAFVVGGIRRVLLAELNQGGESHLAWARQMLPGQFLIDEQTKEPKAMLVPANESDWVLKRYIEPATSWATVTPVVLPGSDEGKFAKAKGLLLKALRHSGYSPEALADFEFRNVSFWPGGDLSLRYRRPDYLRENHWSVYHMRLRWKHPVSGPIAIGAGRHCGLGIFAAIEK